MAIPNCKHVVERLKAEFPQEWATAHFGGPGTEDFIKRLAWVLNTQVDPKFGLLGQRGDPRVLADDAILYRGEGPGHDPTNGNQPVSAFDVIGSAGSTAASPAWNFINLPGPAAWVQPQAVGGSPIPTPVPVPTPAPPSSNQPVLEAVAALGDILGDIHDRLTALEAVAGETRAAAASAAHDAKELNAARHAGWPAVGGPAGPWPVYVGSTKPFGGAVRLTPEVK
jgi:hypothetical protein